MAGYIGSKASVVSSGAERKKTFAITTSTTSLTGLSYTPTKAHVFHNGVRLVDGTDYTATDGTSITLNSAAENGDEVVVISYAGFQVADAYTQAEADAEFVAKAGDTMTGGLTVGGTVTATDFSGDGSGLTGIEGVPAGVVIYQAANTAPTGFIKANGASLSTTTYANLFAAIGYTFGGSGSSFNVPDLRGEFIRGWDDGRGADSGRGFGSYQGHDSRALNYVQYSTASTTAVSVSTSGALSSPVRTGSGTGYGLRFRLSTVETRVRNRALLACIKY